MSVDRENLRKWIDGIAVKALMKALLFSLADIWMNAIKMLVYSIFPASTKIVRIFMATFNSGENGLQTNTWSPTQLFLVRCEIDVTVNVMQNYRNPFADNSLHCRPSQRSHCCRPRWFQRPERVSKPFPEVPLQSRRHLNH